MTTDPTPRDIVCLRTAGGDVRCTIPIRHRHHSPSGVEIGYAGSGPADLALNILALALPLGPDEPGVTLWDGTRVSWAAWQLHQPFKRAFITPMDRDGGTIRGADIAAWLAAARQDEGG